MPSASHARERSTEVAFGGNTRKLVVPANAVRVNHKTKMEPKMNTLDACMFYGYHDS